MGVFFILNRPPHTKSVIDGFDNFVFFNGAGHVYSYKKLNHVLNRICKTIGSEHPEFPHISCHMLRHTFATRMHEAGVDVKATSEILGHKEIAITLNTYVDATSDFKTAQMSILEDYYDKTGEDT